MKLNSGADRSMEAPAKPRAVTVGQVVRAIRNVIEKGFPTPIWVEGELSNCSYPSSGHIYFSLVDEQETDRFGQRLLIQGAFFKGANQGLKFKLTDGLKVLVFGQVTVYEGRGQYQLRVLRVEPKGMGALQLAFEQLKKRLSAEGLFDPERKLPIPAAPEHVGVVTSATGSAVHDMVSKLRDHFRVTLIPVKVQGEGAAQEIAQAITLAARFKLGDVLIVGRGGGSVEDLWAFNEEVVARAIVGSPIPIISAVGHQDDWTIADYVADLRASTPTDAAKLLVNNRTVLLEQSRQLAAGLNDAMTRYLDDRVADLRALCGRLRLLHPTHQLNQYSGRVLELGRQLHRSVVHALEREEDGLKGLLGRLDALSPLAVLSRGYSITFRLPGRDIVTCSDKLKPGDRIETRLDKGTVVSKVETL